MIAELLPPNLLMLAGAVLLAFTRGRAQLAVLVAAPLLALWSVLSLQVAGLLPEGVSPANLGAPQSVFTVPFLSYDVVLVQAASLPRAFSAVLLLSVLALGVFAWRRASRAELVIAYTAAGLAVGVALAGDLIAVFLQWELLALAGAALIWQGHGEDARAAGFRFLVMQLLGGILFKVGMEGAYQQGGYALRAFDAGDPLMWGLLGGILVKAAAVPVAVWLPDAYPRATPVGTAFLALLLPSTALLMLLMLFPGAAALVWIGALMMLYGLVFGLLTGALRTMLCYLLVLQAGAVVVGAGLGTAGSLSAAVSLLLAQLPALALLFMVAAALVTVAGDDALRAVGRWSAREPQGMLLVLIGGLVLCALPFTAGFTGWAGLLGAAATAGSNWLVVLLAVALMGTLLIAVARLSGAVQPAGTAPAGLDAGIGVRVYPAGALLLLTALAVVPWLLSTLPQAGVQVSYVGRWLLILPLLLLGAVVLGVLLARPLATASAARPDIDWLWRVGLFRLGRAAIDGLAVWRATAERLLLSRLGAGRSRLGAMAGANGLFGRDWTTGATSLWVAVLLVAYLLVYYL